VTKDVRIFTAFQHTLRGRENDQVRFGLNAKLDKKTGVFFTETIGQDGNSTRIGIERTEDNKTNYYTHFTLDNDKYGRQSSTITVGGKSQISQRTNIYKEDQFSRNHYSAKFVNLYGINTKLTDKLSADLSYQKTETSNGTSYRSGKLGLNYNSEKIKTGNNLEVRFDNANTDKSQYLLTGFFQYRPNQDITFLTRYEYSLTRSGKITLASFDEIEAGIAYRPVDFDWFNFIYQYRRYRNDSPGYQYDRNNIDVSQSEEHSAEISLDITPKLTLSEKFAYLNKFKRSTGDETSPSSTIMLAHRLNYHFNDKWDIIAEYRTLHQKDSDTLNGFIFEVDRLLNDYLRVGVGYHFAEYQNEMTPTYDYRAKGFFFRFTGTFAWFTPEENKQHRQNIIVAKQKKDMLKYIQIKLEENEGALLKTINERLTSATQELKKKNCEKAMLLYSELDRICIGLKLEAEELAGDYMKNSSNTRAPNRKLYRHYEYDIDKIMKKAAAGTKKAKRYLTAKKF
jgi:opacity protein-like surface antigen